MSGSENPWIEWGAGGDPHGPVGPLVLVQVQLRRETRDDASNDEPEPAGDFIWTHDGGGHDIVAYRVAQP